MLSAYSYKPATFDERRIPSSPGSPVGVMAVPYPVWRCKVCGYLCARNDPPDACPICKAGKNRFERFL